MLDNGNTFENLPDDIQDLKWLKELNLSRRGLTRIPDYVFQLENLALLDLKDNNISYIPPEIKKLVSLRILILSNNQIKELPAEIGQLHKLRYLRLEKNQLSSLPRELRFLHSLKKIYLSRNKFKRFPKILRQLKNLRVLEITHGQFNDLPSGIDNLQKLETLDLRFSKLRIIPVALSKTLKIERLDLSRNHIKNIPPALKDLKQLKYLNVSKNPISIPPEILEQVYSPQTILEYAALLSGGKRFPLNEVKLLFVGQGSIGKTSIVNRIVENNFVQDQAKTEGISIKRWDVTAKRKAVIEETSEYSHDETLNDQSKIRVNIWDFGGQEIMHATHQFFLTKRSLYILVLDARISQEENRVEYWLKIIQSFSGSSPVIVVGNKIDQHPLDIDRTGLKRKYPNIIRIFETSAATGQGINELKSAIIKKVNQLRYVRDLIPENWFAIKARLESLGNDSNYITHDKYIELCEEKEIVDEASQRRLIGFLHDLGVVLHFQDDPRLESLGILNPEWVTNGVYRIINSHTLFQNKGVLTVPMLDEILNLSEYPRGKRLFIVDMMKKFELCYDIEPDKTFLVPDLLPKGEPADLKFKGIPAFEYNYPVLPSSVLTRFIVRMNQHIHDNCLWRTGVLLKIGENKALVKADIEDRKITIAIDGLEHTRRDALSAIRYQLDEIHASIKGLEPQKRVPIPGARNAEPLEYEYLLMLEREGDETCRVKDGSRLVTVNVRQVLSAIESEAQRKERAGNVTNIYVGGNVDGNMIIGDENVSSKS